MNITLNLTVDKVNLLLQSLQAMTGALAAEITAQANASIEAQQPKSEAAPAADANQDAAQ